MEALDAWLNAFRDNSTAVVPWLLAGVVVAAVIGWSPLGRGLLHRSKKGELGDPSLRDLVDEVNAMRGELADVHERLDWAERTITNADLQRIDPPPVTRRSTTPV